MHVRTHVYARNHEHHDAHAQVSTRELAGDMARVVLEPHPLRFNVHVLCEQSLRVLSDHRESDLRRLSRQDHALRRSYHVALRRGRFDLGCEGWWVSTRRGFQK